MKIIIAGAGVAGLAVGWRLVQGGAEVSLGERGRAGRGASWAAAGMLAPGGEADEEKNALAWLARAALEAWPGFAAELEGASGCNVGLRPCGSLILAMDEARAQALRD